MDTPDQGTSSSLVYSPQYKLVTQRTVLCFWTLKLPGAEIPVPTFVRCGAESFRAEGTERTGSRCCFSDIPTSFSNTQPSNFLGSNLVAV